MAAILQQPRRALLQLFNLRITVFLFVVAAPVGWILYVWLCPPTTPPGWVNLHELGHFPFDDQFGTILDVPKRWRDLDGKHVEMEGFAYRPSESVDGMTEFRLVHDIHGYWGGPPLVQENVFCRAKTQLMNVISAPDDIVLVHGILHVKVQRPMVGWTKSIFTMDVSKIEDVMAPQPAEIP